MPKELPVLPSVKIAMRHAARCAQGALAGIDHASLPVPVPGPEGTRWAVLLSPTRRDEAKDVREIGAPAYVLGLRADVAEPVELAQVSPSEVGLEGGPDAWLGELAPAAEASKRARLAELLDAVVPVFATGRPGATEAQKSAAAELRALFDEVAEAPLLPCYRAVGKRFFAWLDRTAGEEAR